MDEVLEWFNDLCASAYPGCEVSCRCVLNRPQSSLYSCYVNPSPTVEKAVAIVLESRPTHIAFLPTFCSILCSTRILHCNRGMLQMRQRMGMCETLMVVPGGALCASEWSQLCTWAQLTYFWSTMQDCSIIQLYAHVLLICRVEIALQLYIHQSLTSQNCNWHMRAVHGQYKVSFLFPVLSPF